MAQSNFRACEATVKNNSLRAQPRVCELIKRQRGVAIRRILDEKKQNFSPYGALNVPGFYQTPNNMVQLLQHSTANIQPPVGGIPKPSLTIVNIQPY